jgi:hypothetical protein
MERHFNRLEISALVAEIVGSIAVVISVIYLAVQINGNTAALYNQSHYNSIMLAQRSFEVELSTPEMAVLLERGDNEPEALSAPELRRYSAFNMMQFNGWEYVYYGRETGVATQELWIGYDGFFRARVEKFPGVRRFWKETKHSYAEPFHSYVNDLVASAEASQ